LGVGSLVFVTEDGLTPAPERLWPEHEWIGVVRAVLEDELLVDIAGNLRIFESSAIDATVGNTVAGTEVGGVRRVLSADPIRPQHFSEDDASNADSFRELPNADLGFEDFGGLPHVVERARKLIEISLEGRDQLRAIGARPIKGVLFTGPPGTGKTLLARIIASRSSAAFYEIGGPEIFSKWYGQSEQLLRDIFEDARQQERSIVFFDEIDSVAARREEGAHEVSKRVVGQLLTLMDGFRPEDNVVVVAATNRVEAIDEALRRPGRFDWEIVFPMPSLEDRKAILLTSGRKMRVVDDLPHDQVAAATEGWSAAKLAAIWTEAALLAVDDGRSSINLSDYIGGMQAVGARPEPASQ
jgi:transitional endoplasmic reticulum ATPase